MTQILLIGVAGALGAICRYGLSKLFNAPWGTFVANVIGCFLIGLIATATLQSDAFPKAARVALITGFLGALTTFSTFSYDTVLLASEGRMAAAVANVGLNLAVGIGATIGGIALAKSLV